MLDVIEKTQNLTTGGDHVRQAVLSGISTLGKPVPRQTWKAGGNRLSLLGVGCARAGSIRNYTPVREIRNMLAMALDLGVNHIDMANTYGQGDAERIVGRVIKNRRDDAFLVTKIGFSFGGGSRLVSGLKPLLRTASKYSSLIDRKLGQARDTIISQDFSPDKLMPDLEGSLQRLGVEVLDGLLLHSPPLSVLEDERVMECLRSAKAQGKIRHFGAAVETVDQARRALEIDGLEILQVDVDTARQLARGPASKILARKDIALIVREILTSHGRVKPNHPVDIADALPEALSIANVTSAIVGLSSRKHLQAAIEAIR